MVGRRLLNSALKSGELEGELHSEQWFWFVDANGKGFAQPDHYIVGKDSVLIVEVKLKQNSTAHLQLDWLYRPLLEKFYEKPAFLLQVFKYPRFAVDERRVGSITDVFARRRESIHELHWLGD